MRKFWSEPLLHFLLLGLGLFALYRVVSPESATSRSIVVNDATIDFLSRRHASVWQRPPTPAELRGLVDDYIRDEILYREGVAMGLDRDDPVIKRRVLQKLDVISEESGARGAPTDAELADYLRKHADRYAQPPVFDFQQVMFDPARHGERLEADFNAALARLNAGADPATVGDSSLLPGESQDVPLDRLAKEYGEEFAAAIKDLPVGGWQGPVRSGFGVHLVRVHRRTSQVLPGLAEVRAAVERDWESDRRRAASDAWYREVRQKYDIRITARWPGTGSSAPDGTAGVSSGESGR